MEGRHSNTVEALTKESRLNHSKHFKQANPTVQFQL